VLLLLKQQPGVSSVPLTVCGQLGCGCVVDLQWLTDAQWWAWQDGPGRAQPASVWAVSCILSLSCLQVLLQFQCHAPVSSFGMGSLSWRMIAIGPSMADAYFECMVCGEEWPTCCGAVGAISTTAMVPCLCRHCSSCVALECASTHALNTCLGVDRPHATGIHTGLGCSSCLSIASFSACLECYNQLHVVQLSAVCVVVLHREVLQPGVCVRC